MSLPSRPTSFLLKAIVGACLASASGAQAAPTSAGSLAVSTNDVTESVLYSFVKPPPPAFADSASSALIEGSDGNLYGATEGFASTFGEAGSVFRLTPAGQYSRLYSFGATSTDGVNPYGPLIEGKDGGLYGTTIKGGANNLGAVFKLTKSGIETILHSFGESANDGQTPFAGLLQGTDGNFYGTTSAGGAAGTGTIYELTPAGQETVLYSFSADGASGYYPSGLAFEYGGEFYGVAGGGAQNVGVVYKFSPGTGYSVLYSFGTSAADGSWPNALIMGRDGHLYGTTEIGGTMGGGTVFELNDDGTDTIVYSFAGGALTVGKPPPTDAGLPVGLILGSDGNFYGASNAGGDCNHGTFFQITPGQGEIILHSFQCELISDAAVPLYAPIQARSGVFYGPGFGGGENQVGAIYQLSMPIAPAPPTRLAAAGGNTLVKLQWNAATAATSYNIFMGTTPGGESSTPVRTGITGTTAVIGGLTNKTRYYFTVVAVNGAGTSPASSEVSAIPHRRKP